MVRLLAALVVLLLSASALAGPLSRWSISPLQRVYDISVAGRTDSNFLAILNDGKVWRSLDGGRTWTAVTIPGGGAWALSNLQNMVGSPHDSRTWYVMANGGSPHVTRDAGETWSPVSMSILGLAFGATPNLLYESSLGFPDSNTGHPTGGVSGRVSVDGGITWRQMGNVRSDLVIRGAAPSLSDANVVYSWGPNGAMRSADQGATWRDATPPIPLYSGSLRRLEVDRLDADIVYANAFTTLDHATYASRDGGLTWTRTPLEWIVNTVPDPLVRGRAFAFSFNATVYETRDGGLSWVVVEGSQPASVNPANSGPPWMNQTMSNYPYRASSVGIVGGKRVGLTASFGTLALVGLEQGPLALGSDLWWNPAAPGTGLTITQHPSNQVFMVWYAYDALGKQVWRVMPGGTWNDRTMTGALYETDGPPYFQGAFDTSRVKLNPVGVATLEFRDQDNATLIHASSAGANLSRTPISRMRFGDLAAPTITSENLADIWYNAAESGWGVGISHQGDRIFATWYVYGDDGRPMWITMPDSVLETTTYGAFVRPLARGDIYTTRGNPDGSYSSTKVGTAVIAFRENNRAEIAYSAFGRTKTTEITRIPF